MRFASIESMWHLAYRDCPRGVPREAKMCKNVLKWRTFELTDWITEKRLKIDEYILRCVWQALNPLFIHVTFTAIVPGAYPGEAKMCIRLSWLSQMLPPAKRVRQRHTGVTAWLVSREVAKFCLRPRLIQIAETDVRSVGDSTVAYNWQPSPKPHPHHTNTTPTPHFLKKVVVWVWCWCGVGVVWAKVVSCVL